LLETKESLEEQLEQLKSLYIESKKLVKNLVLAGDHFGEFELKFSETASALKITQTDINNSTDELKQTAKLLGNMVNSLAQKVPDDKKHLAQRSDIVEKFQSLVTLAVKYNKTSSETTTD
jgi:hypothetical protein